MTTGEVSLFVDPPSRHFERDLLFDTQAAGPGGIDPFEPFVFLRHWFGQRGVAVHTADLLESGEIPGTRTNIYVSLGVRDRYQKLAARSDVVLSGFFALECPVVEPNLYRDLTKIDTSFKRIFSYSTAEALAPFLRGPVHLSHFLLPQSGEGVDDRVWPRKDRKFLIIINGNKVPRVYVNELYTERLRAVEFFNRRGEIDLYGVGWDGPPFQMGETRVPATVRRLGHATRKRLQRRWPPSDPLRVAAREANRGPAGSKLDTLAGYTFSICFENSILEGWITEKLFDCFYAGTVPIYWGAPDVERWIPRECFVDMRQFADYAELRDFLLSCSSNDIETYRAAARDFFHSEAFRPFSKQAFAELVGSLVREDGGLVE